MSNNTVAIIGAGLTGLFLAHELVKQNKQVILLEARERAGGRILSLSIDKHPDANVDLGPAWVWPQLQPHLSKILNELEIDVFKQFTDGDMLFQHHDGSVQRYSNQSAHAESYRITGGAQRLINVLLERLRSNPLVEIIFDTRVTAIDQQVQRVYASQNQSHVEFAVDKVISTMPLRLLANNIEIVPAINPDITNAWRAIPTWMAAHCKMLFIYGSPFWREQGLSGEVFSQRGPLSEIYDGTPHNHNDNLSVYALTSFVGLNAAQRNVISEEQLKELSLKQLNLLFGEQAQHVDDILIKDWSHDPLTTTQADLHGVHEHPHYPDLLPRQFYDGYLSLAGTETALQYGGYIEGALESANNLIRCLDTK